MGVCKLWTDVAMNTISIWQNIEVRTTGNWLAIVLPRSKGMPLDVTVHCASRILPSIVSSLTEEAPRLRRLSVCEGGADVVDLLEDTVLSVDRLPCLETLLVEYCGDAYAPLDFISFDEGDRFPALRVLDLNSSYVPWDTSIFRQLRVLRISETWVPHSSTVPLSVFLAVLQMCQNLEELDFSFVYFIDFEDHEPDETGFTVSLPRLRSFHWFWPDIWAFGSPTDVYQLLERLHFTRSVDIYLEFEVHMKIHDSHEEHENIDYLHIIPPDSACLPILRTMTSADLHGPESRTFRDGWANDSLSGRDDLGTLKLSFNYNYSGGREARAPWPFSRTAQCTNFCTLFARAPLTSLTIDPHELPQAPLLRVFRTFPHLSTLELFSGSGDVDATCVEGLFAVLAMDACGPRHHPVTAIILPALRTLRFEGIRQSVHMQVLCALLSCLALRAKRGAALLFSLRVEVQCPHIDGTNAEGTKTCEELLAALQAVVKEPVELKYVKEDKVSKFLYNDIESHMTGAD
ncbi:uncharacterized protein TRAVEDRAFT_73229 [Trametes versicolor FP-101664 SS1]|uniref:uncharacterized protein n=1 Tax=Trametes versicolor (strain FP-101664) TaxID=717944 RepID=UPI00046238E3|nr:uncharacterized protein TRAVEDRAFT_73229 [Trametes versicolor FP-101664 SS1]EIW56853.1 hypothetical protein TRAVEDRAFT_73229 [Trametes versicolor FP-101664 SS1]